MQSEPDRRATQQQRVQQQVQIQIAVHADKLTGGIRRVNLFVGFKPGVSFRPSQFSRL
jgi:hypothetical protein